MGDPLSITFFNIYLTKQKKDQVKPHKPKFYRRFVDEVISGRLKNTIDSLLENLNNYHKKIIETNPQKMYRNVHGELAQIVITIKKKLE